MSRKQYSMGMAGFFLVTRSWLALAQANQPQPGWDWPGPWHMWAGGWGFWWFLPFLMFGLMILVCVFFMLRGPWTHRDPHGDTTKSALILLNERFAKGDISKEEFEDKKAILVRRT